MKNVIFIDGDKGGVGKSQTLIWLAESLLSKGIESFDIVEADKQNDIGLRYGAGATFAPLFVDATDTASSGVARIFEAIENSQFDTVLVNLPAVASERIGGFVDEIRDVIDEMNARLFVVFVGDDQAHSLNFFNKSCESGLLSIATASAVVLNGRFSPVIEAFALHGETGSIPTILMPPLDERMVGKMKIEKSQPYSVTMTSLTLLDRSIVRNWIKAAAPLRALALGEKE